ncbi:nucleoside ABC transporter ATP-binding protein [Coriobacterium glomerans PW2]|uniref:Nucleoside ABC transporter ATP-binding protein n=1 Tax=Coriobacterium glomerans (strain ATCC 49209 / DSM 20642 / JCM 10262 / PW2) TaxID=700015 RepID=F2NBA0_CORGP|nr:ABC transporter ATP-binding protein [Coriobacterium glomerans]AEB06636.1 nucleoside ABC transporter ATP-binding protein [Coriobacterium glomerans PW2]
MEPDPRYAVQMHGIVKQFGSFTALDHVHLDIRRGSVHAILGENGAGKSTLMNILYGLYQAEEGTIFLDGRPTDINSPADAIAAGIGMVHQHFMLVDDFTVTENIILGDEITRGPGLLDMNRAREAVQKIISEYGLEVDPDAKVEDISVGMQQRVEILKALFRGAQTLILDEPTAVLTPQEIDRLVDIMHALASRGKTIIIITHKLREIKASSEMCTIIRRGSYIDTVRVADVSEQQLAEKMVGGHVSLIVEKTPADPGEVVLEIRDLVAHDERGLAALKGLSLAVRAGEIVGVAGIDGNGQRELVDAIAGITRARSGTISVHGSEIQNTTPRNVLEHGVATIPDDRQRRGLVLPFTVAENTILEGYRDARFGSNGMLDRRRIDAYTSKLISDYDVRPADCADLPAASLSGGNQQKIIIGREIESRPDVLVAAQPTRGLDVGAISYVHETLIAERDRGAAVLLVSLELDEIMNVADTIAVIYAGAIVGTFKQGQIDENLLGLLMAGGSQS